MRRSKSLLHSARPDPSYVDASLVEFVRRRVQSDGRKFKEISHRGPAPRSPSTRRRSSSAPPKPQRKSLLTLRGVATSPKQDQRNDAPAPQRARFGRRRSVRTQCPCCDSPILLTRAPADDSNYCCTHGRDRCQSCPVTFCGDDGKNPRSERILSREKESAKEKESHVKTKEVVKYTISCGFTVKRKFKTTETKTKSGQVDIQRASDGDKDITRSATPCKECTCQAQETILKEASLGEEKEPKTLGRDGTAVRLRRSKQEVYFQTARPRPLSDGALYQNSGGILRLFQFDDEFNPIKNARPSQNAGNDMKTTMSKKPVRIHLLNNDSVVLVFETKATVQQLFDQVCSLLSVKEGQFFGLSTIVDNEKRFMDLKHKILRYAPKEWGKEIKRRASDLGITSSAVLTVQFQVQFYVEHPKLISDKTSRHLYYLQMKKNVARSRVLTQDEILFTLASHALQSDLGDHDPAVHKKQYFKPEDYFPSWFIQKWGREYLLSHLPSLHAEHNGRSAFDSQALYIQQASSIDDVPVHYYKLFKNKKESKPSVLLGIFHQGIRIHYGNPDKGDSPWKLEFEFMWNKVGRLFFTGKRFEIYPEDLPASRKLTYYTGSNARSKYLLHFLRETHSIYMSLSPYAQHMRRVDGKRTKRRYRESYISGKNLSLASADATSNEQQSTDNEDDANKAKQDKEKAFRSYYQSTTSHGSSHTSGIESDLKQRTEGEEEDEEDPDGADRKKEFVNITEDHLAGPPPKSLSVNNLADPELTETKEKPPRGSVIDVKNSDKPSRDSTLTGEDLRIPSDIPLNNNTDLKTPKYSSLSSENREDTLKNGVPLEVLMTAVMRTQADQNQPTETVSEKEQRKKSNKNGPSDRRPLSFINAVEKAEKKSDPKELVNDKAKLYYDDTHTIPRKSRTRSRTEEPKKSSRDEKGDPDHRRHHRHSRSSQDRVDGKKNAKRSHSAQPKPHSESRHRRAPADSFSWLPTNRPIERTHSSDQSTPAFAVSGEKIRNRHGKSVNSIPSTFLPLQGSTDLRSHKRNSAFVSVAKPTKNGNLTDKGYYTVARGYDKYVYYDDVKSGGYPGTNTNTSRKDKPRRSEKETHFHYVHPSDKRERLSSYEDETFSQKMSEACMRTLSAQRRKLSDSRFSHRMDSGRGSLRTTDDSSSCLDMSPHEHNPTHETQDFITSPHTPSNKHNPLHYNLLRTPFIENYNEVIV